MPEPSALRPVPPLPATKSDLATHLTYKQSNKLIDDVHELIVLLWEDPTFQALLAAPEGFDELAVYGSTDADDFAAAAMIQEKAREIGMERPTDPKKRNAVRKAMRGVLGRRYDGVSRKDRREAMEGNGGTAPPTP